MTNVFLNGYRCLLQFVEELGGVKKWVSLIETSVPEILFKGYAYHTKGNSGSLS